MLLNIILYVSRVWNCVVVSIMLLSALHHCQRTPFLWNQLQDIFYHYSDWWPPTTYFISLLLPYIQPHMGYSDNDMMPTMTQCHIYILCNFVTMQLHIFYNSFKRCNAQRLRVSLYFIRNLHTFFFSFARFAFLCLLLGFLFHPEIDIQCFRYMQQCEHHVQIHLHAQSSIRKKYQIYTPKFNIKLH